VLNDAQQIFNGPKCGLQTVRKMLLGARLAGRVAKGFAARLRATLSEDQTFFGQSRKHSSDSRERPPGREHAPPGAYIDAIAASTAYGVEQFQGHDARL
jgi:hypothetical protein